jgi:hypothetical protein
MKRDPSMGSGDFDGGLFRGVPPPVRCDGDVPVHGEERHTEQAAADRIAPIRETLKAKVLQWIRDAAADGITMKEAGALYAAEKGRHPTDGSCRYSCAPRITELAAEGLVSDSGRVRGQSIIWVAKA